MLHKFYEAIRISLQERKIDVIKHLRMGNCGSYEDYRFNCGKLNAYDHFTIILDDLYDRFQMGKSPELNKKHIPQEEREELGE